MSTARKGKFNAFDTNSTEDVVLGTDQPGYQVACTEVWGGNSVADEVVRLPGLVALIHSKPAGAATTSGDVYYLSVCDKRMLSRVVLADVAGHDETVDGTAIKLRTLLKKHINLGLCGVEQQLQGDV